MRLQSQPWHAAPPACPSQSFCCRDGMSWLRAAGVGVEHSVHVALQHGPAVLCRQTGPTCCLVAWLAVHRYTPRDPNFVVSSGLIMSYQ